MTLRPYQQAAADAAIEWMRFSAAPFLIDAATGAGKSHIIAEIARVIHGMTGKRVLCLAPSAELVTQNRAKFIATGNPASMFSASAGGKDLRHPVVFGSPLTVKNKISRFQQAGKAGYALVIVDECFPAGTMISTPLGDKPIELVRSGDVVFNAIGSGVVRQKITRTSSNIVEVAFSDGTKTRCTRNHPFFTGMGWKSAGSMVRGEVVFCRQTLPLLWGGVSTEEIFSQGQGKNISGKRGWMVASRDLQSILREEISKPDAQRSIAGENVCNAFINWSQAETARGKRVGHDKAASHDGGCAGAWMDSRVCSEDWEKGGGWVPSSLQDRHCKPGNDDSHRSGRREPLYTSEAGAGREKRRPTSIKRVESVSRIECGGDQVVYNLHISGHPSYFANGALVHNCHGITPTVQSIIDAMREGNPNLRVCGLTATPYRLGSGYIFREWPDGRTNGEDVARDPYFAKCVYQIGARELIAGKYLTPPVIGAIGAAGYDTSGLTLNSRGQFDADAVDRAYCGHGRKTAAIVADVVGQSANRQGVMFFAATVKHAQEVMASLPPELSQIVTGETPKAERESILARFKARRIKYLVNVSVLTTGFDAPHVDVIAILRKTESVGLLQQIIGRGLRLDDGKRDCLVLDYTTNLEDHCPDGDLFAPTVRAGKAPSEGGGMICTCPSCQYENSFTARPEYIDKGGGLSVSVDGAGYVLDLDGRQVEGEHGPMPAHFGRRCMGMVLVNRRGEYERCGYRWTFKECPHCTADNDIAARYCRECKGEIVDPNEKLAADFKAMKRDPTQMQTDEVKSMSCVPGISRAGNKTLRVEWVTPYRQFTTWFQPEASHTRGQVQWQIFDAATQGGTVAPKTVTYRKDAVTGFYEVKAYNKEPDHAPV